MNVHTQGFLHGLRGSKLHLVLNWSFFVETGWFLACIHYPRRILTQAMVMVALGWQNYLTHNLKHGFGSFSLEKDFWELE